MEEETINPIELMIADFFAEPENADLRPHIPLLKQLLEIEKVDSLSDFIYAVDHQLSEPATVRSFMTTESTSFINRSISRGYVWLDEENVMVSTGEGQPIPQKYRVLFEASTNFDKSHRQLVKSMINRVEQAPSVQGAIHEEDMYF